MIMNTPVPYGKSTLNNSPLLADGSDFPCKQRTGVYEAEGASNAYPLGSTQKLAFTGSATHGGGSCQVSITYDKAPTKDSVWKVIHSIEGGCPIQGVAGNNGDNAAAVNPDTYSFTVPTTLPTGEATLAWTWFNKIGNREMYMNCAPVTLSGSSSKRSDDGNVTQLMERDTAAFDALPDMFTANIGNGCTTVDSTDLKFPSPGDSLDLLGTSTATPVAPSGSCATAASGGSGSGSGSGTGSTATSAAASSPKATQKSTSAAGIPGGVFATVAPVASPTTLVPVASSAAAVSSAPAVSAAPVASSAPSVAPVASPVASSASPAPSSGTSTGTTGSGTAEVAGSACATEGMWNCIAGTSYQRCASGTWSVVMQLAAGTTCTAGQSTAINITAIGKAKRAVRFSNAHVRRHIHMS